MRRRARTVLAPRANVACAMDAGSCSYSGVEGSLLGQKELGRRGVNTRVTGARGDSTQAEDEHAARALVGLSMDGSGGGSEGGAPRGAGDDAAPTAYGQHSDRQGRDACREEDRGYTGPVHAKDHREADDARREDGRRGRWDVAVSESARVRMGRGEDMEARCAGETG